MTDEFQIVIHDLLFLTRLVSSSMYKKKKYESDRQPLLQGIEWISTSLKPEYLQYRSKKGTWWHNNETNCSFKCLNEHTFPYLWTIILFIRPYLMIFGFSTVPREVGLVLHVFIYVFVFTLSIIYLCLQMQNNSWEKEEHLDTLRKELQRKFQWDRSNTITYSVPAWTYIFRYSWKQIIFAYLNFFQLILVVWIPSK